MPLAIVEGDHVESDRISRLVKAGLPSFGGNDRQD
jgi:hypothetical protein